METSMEECQHCDGLGGQKTYRNQVPMPLNGRVQSIDYCIAHLVAALNAANIRTVGSCCGHRRMAGRIDLEDGRVLAIINDLQELGPGQPVWHASEQWRQPLAER